MERKGKQRREEKKTTLAINNEEESTHSAMNLLAALMWKFLITFFYVKQNYESEMAQWLNGSLARRE